MATVSDRIREGYENARARVRDLEHQVVEIEKKAKAQLDEVPGQLKTAWDGVVDRVRGAVAFARKDELKAIATKLEEVAAKVEQLIRGDKGRAEKKTKSA